MQKWNRSEEIGGYILFYRDLPNTLTREWCIEGHFPSEWCQKVQAMYGFHPGGYGFYQHYRGISPRSGKKYTYWSSSNNCE